MTIDLQEWISLAEAARLVPSPLPGRKTAISSVWRWARKYKWPTLRRGCYTFVRRSDVLGLFQLERPPAVVARGRGHAKWTERVLKQAGLVK
jgi:hypothetical protein